MADDFLAAPIPGADYGIGGIVPLVQSRYGVRESGLIVPIAYVRPPVPLDTVATYLTGTEVFGLRIPAATTVSHLHRLPLTMVLRFCADLLHRIDSPQYSSAEVDGALKPSFTENGWQRVRSLTASGERILVAPHVVLVLLTHAARFSNDCVLPDVAPGLPVIAMLGTADDLEQLGGLDEVEETLIIGAGVPGRMERELVSIADFHGRLEPEHLIGRFVRRWIVLPAEHASHPEILDVSAEFARVIGVSIEEFIAAGILLYSASIAVGPSLPRDQLVQCGIRPDASRRILALISSTVPDLRAWAQDSSAASMWEFGHLGRFPLVDDGEALIVVRPRMVLDRFFGRFPYLDIWHTLPKAEQERLRGCFGRLAELYALETMHAQAERRGYRVVEESALRAGLRSRNEPGRICDIALSDGRRWALFEITSSQLARPSVIGTSADKLDDDFAKLVGKIEQLDDTITALRAGESRLTGEPVHRHRRFYPVLVLTEGFPVNPVTVTMLRERAQAAGYLCGDDIAELEVVDVVELEIVEGARVGGPGLLDVLDSKQRSTLDRSSLRDFLVLDQKITSSTPPRVAALAAEDVD